jgi:ribosomal protein S27E
VQEEFAAYLKCGRLEHGFLRVRCEDCHAEKLVAFSCKRRGFCPSCGARRMTDTAALLADEVLPQKPLRQWVLSRRSRCGSCLPLQTLERQMCTARKVIVPWIDVACG